jgi:endonuclease YncB( thermonuclease family)
MPRRIIPGVSLLLSFYLVSPVLADFTGRVVGVSDGETIKVMHNGRAEKIQLYGIDCPEKAQPFGSKAKQFTSEMVFGKVVRVEVKDFDRYGRTVEDEILPNGRVLNRELVAAGLAWWYRQYSQDATLGQLEVDARAARRGLWADLAPVPPWCWRMRQKGREC